MHEITKKIIFKSLLILYDSDNPLLIVNSEHQYAIGNINHYEDCRKPLPNENNSSRRANGHGYFVCRFNEIKCRNKKH